VGESNECIAIRHPKPEGRVHLVLFPKRDVRNVLELQPEDGPYVLGCFALARKLTDLEGVRNYRLLTNGPALQHVTYLHFHVIAK
jgi:diadenosine tetraphosphate (Ap4A) HIT family hydrolase